MLKQRQVINKQLPRNIRGSFFQLFDFFKGDVFRAYFGASKPDDGVGMGQDR